MSTHCAKLLMVGDEQVGKTALLQRYCECSFPESYRPTIGVDLVAPTQRIRTAEVKGQELKLQIWELAGQKRFRAIATHYFRQGVGIFLVFDVTKRSSLQEVKDWVDIARVHSEQAVLVLVGNKCEDSQAREVSTEEALRFANSICAPYIETSAKADTNVSIAFALMTALLPSTEPAIPVPPKDPDDVFKVLIIGDAATGKSALLQRLVEDSFVESYRSTIGVDFVSLMQSIYTFLVHRRLVKLQIWDTAGFGRFRAALSSYPVHAHCIMLVYDITDRPTFLNLANWQREINYEKSASTCLLLVGNKSDREQQRAVTSEEGAKVAEAAGYRFIEVSAKTGVSVHQAFEALASDAILVKDLQSTEKFDSPATVKRVLEQHNCTIN